MTTYEDARRTKEHFAIRLLKDHPHIVSIAPELVFDDSGMPTEDAKIVVGTRRLSVSEAARVKQIPNALALVDVDGKETTGSVPLEVVEEGEILPEAWTTRERPCPGGYSIGHTAVTAGTFGLNARWGSDYGFILSNNHVLADTNAGAIGDNIIQPGDFDGGAAPADTVGTLFRFVPIDMSGTVPNEVDCALAQATAPWANIISRNIQSIGTPSALGDATVGQRIRKAGRTTELTYGYIRSTDATLSPTGLGLFVNQLKYSRMTDGGDSGSAIFDADSLTVVGLHFAGSPGGFSYGNKIRRVFELLGQSYTIYSIDGRVTHLDKGTLSI